MVRRFGCALTLALAAVAASASADSLTWRTKSPAPVALRRTAGCSVGSYFYLIGGLDESGPVERVYRFDNLLGDWEERAAMPFPTAGHCAVYFAPQNRIYVFGGEMQIAYEYVQVYDVSRDSWFFRVMPHADYGMSAAVLGDSIFVAYGAEHPGLFYRYHPAANGWASRVAAPDSAHSGAMCGLGGRVYYGGGWDSLRVFRSYDPLSDEWTVLPDLPQGRHGVGLIPLAGEVYMVGGGQRWSSAVDARAVHAFNPDSGRWRYDSNTEFNHIAGAYGTYSTLCDAYVIAVAGYNARACEVGHKLVSAIEEESLAVGPHVTLTAFPNPFRAQAAVRLTLPRQVGRERVRIYDARGRVVRLLGPNQAEAAVVIWDGKDGAGRAVPSGAYFVVCGGERLAVRKLD